MPFPLLAGLTAFLGSKAGAAAVGIGKALGGVVQAKRARDRQDSSIQRLVADARAAGIHPLAALGSPIAGSFGTPMTGSAVGDAVDGWRASSLDSKQGKLLDAQIATEEAKRLALLSEATSRTRYQQARQATSSGAPIPLWVQYQDRDGNILWGPNPQIPDFDQMPVPGMIHGTDVFVGDKPGPDDFIPVLPPPAGAKPLLRSDSYRDRQERRKGYKQTKRNYAPWEH